MGLRSALSGNNASTDVTVFGSSTGAAAAGGGGGSVFTLPGGGGAPWSTDAADDATIAGNTTLLDTGLRRYRDLTINAGIELSFSRPALLIARDIIFADTAASIVAWHFGSGGTGSAANGGAGKGAYQATSIPDYILGLMRSSGIGAAGATAVSGDSSVQDHLATVLRAWEIGVLGGGGGGGAGVDAGADTAGVVGVDGASGGAGVEAGGGGGSGIGGGGGGGQSTAAGADGQDGGAGGGMLIVVCRRIITAAGLINADGVDGVAGDATNGGAGGGGGGGAVLLYVADPANSLDVTPTAAGGSKGTAAGTAQEAGGGGSGIALKFLGANG